MFGRSEQLSVREITRLNFRILRIFFDFLSLKIGRGEANVFEPTQFSIKRTYRVQWKKQGPNPDELAKLYWGQGLTITEISTRLGAPRTTVHDAIERLKFQHMGGSK